jgi:hypothetical protein
MQTLINMIFTNNGWSMNQWFYGEIDMQLHKHANVCQFAQIYLLQQCTTKRDSTHQHVSWRS